MLRGPEPTPTRSRKSSRPRVRDQWAAWIGRLIASGRPDDRTDRSADRVQSVWAYFFGQKKVIEKTTIPAKRAKPAKQ
jgi:hypothetical protein